MKVLVTGAHLTPAVAVIRKLQKNRDVKVVYVGRKKTMEGDRSPSVESEIIPQMGVKFIPIITGRLQRSFTIYTIPSLLKIPVGFIQAFYIIFTQKPDVILSVGGYVAVPLVLIGWFFSIPIIVHEQTLVSGLANTICNFFADKIAVTFQKRVALLESKTIVTGNPIREEVLNTKIASLEFKKLFSKKMPSILVTGGNQGSHIINENVGEVMEKLNKDFLIVHQTGDSKYNDFDRLNDIKVNLEYPDRYIVKKWIDGNEWGYILKNVDLVISRAGANTLLELAYFGIPAILIPLPYLYEDEQNENAKFFSKLGFVQILPQKYLNPENLLQNIKKMFKEIKTLKENAKKAKGVMVMDAAQKIALEVILLGTRAGKID